MHDSKAGGQSRGERGGNRAEHARHTERWVADDKDEERQGEEGKNQSSSIPHSGSCRITAYNHKEQDARRTHKEPRNSEFKQDADADDDDHSDEG